MYKLTMVKPTRVNGWLLLTTGSVNTWYIQIFSTMYLTDE